MSIKSIAWDSGGGYIKLTYGGSGNGSITVESDQNNSASARSKTITIQTTAGGVVTKNLTVSQAAGDPTLSVSPEAVTIPWDASESKSFTVTSNTSWTVE